MQIERIISVFIFSTNGICVCVCVLIKRKINIWMTDKKSVKIMGEICAQVCVTGTHYQV